MARATQLKHRYLANTALPYITNDSATGTSPSFTAGLNILTSIRGYAERRPGFPLYASGMSGTVKRIFVWERWDGAFFVMACAVTAGSSDVYKLRVGTDTSFVLIYNDTSTTVPWDFAVSNNKVFFGNDKRIWKYEGNGTTVSPVGIGIYTDAAHKPTTALTGTGISAYNGGFQYVYAYGNSSTGHVSSASYFSAATGNFSNKTVVVTAYKTTDAQVDELHVYRTTDGGGGIYFEITGSPFTHVPGTGTMDVNDTTTDVDLSSVMAPAPEINEPPEINSRGLQCLTWFSSRLWGARDNEVRYSGWEEVLNGVEEESWPSENVFVFESKVLALASVQEALLVFLAGSIWKITGDSVDTFRKELLFKNYGCRSQANVASRGRVVAWIDVGNTIRITDGISQEELSAPIRPDLASLIHANAGLAFYTSGTFHWLVVSTGTYLYAYDLDTRMWMPPWGIASSALASGEVSAGVFGLFAGTGGNIWRCNATGYSDVGGSYNANATTNLFDIVPDPLPGALGELEYVGIETDAASISVSQLTDEDPNLGSFTSITANRVDAPRRTQGTYLNESWYYCRTPAARRVSVKIDFGSSASNFKLYSLNFAYKEAP